MRFHRRTGARIDVARALTSTFEETSARIQRAQFWFWPGSTHLEPDVDARQWQRCLRHGARCG
jgi:hypothetical protein